MSLETALRALPTTLGERTRTLGVEKSPPRFVLYWMRTAVRAHENPALDTALVLGKTLGLPVFCYHALSERYPFASDRHHMFVLEGAQDVEAQFEERGIGYAFHLERRGHRGPHLRVVAEHAGVVVTEDMPVPPLTGWTEAVSSLVPVVLVDTACVVPMRLTRRPARAFAHRKATRELRDARIVQGWTEVTPGQRFVPELPFEPLKLATADLPSLVAECEIDHGVGPVADTIGGSAAGYARWNAFVADGLRSYHRKRNDPLANAVSRMSAYLHYGFVSPFRLAREAHHSGLAGADKFLDELLLWRELAYAFCFHEPAPDTLAALPPWAHETLTAHASDPRSPASWETLARARSGSELWDHCQESLLRHGELHNNLRMTWGKALLQWTRSPEEALSTLIDLNHRYALDGRDPASYGGLLWCLGLFDRPFPPAGKVRGTVRPRPLGGHANRIDVGAYRIHVRRTGIDPGSVAVIGAGISGLACARTLADHGVDVRVFDKGRRVGGRLATRRQDGHQFDHGAQFFRPKDPRFERYVRSWIRDDVVAQWEFRELHYDDGTTVKKRRPVGQGSNRRLAEHLAQDLDVRLETRVAPLPPGDRRLLADVEGHELGEFDRVVVTTPLAQAADLLVQSPKLVSMLQPGKHAATWALMIGLRGPVPIEADVLVGDGPIGWAAREASKPGRPEGERWIIHASSAWTEAHLEADASEVEEMLVAAFRALVPGLPGLRFCAAHRWRYARVATPVGLPCLSDAGARTLVAGDGLLGARVEAAWLSGVAAAGRLLGATLMPSRGDLP
ncbi:MAG: FAD-dependent oxidoreductase [Myxococcota bacterium]